MRESTAYQYILKEGRIEQARDTVLLQGRIRFGPPSPGIEMAIGGITDISRLDHMLGAILRANSWEELLSTT